MNSLGRQMKAVFFLLTKHTFFPNFFELFQRIFIFLFRFVSLPYHFVLAMASLIFKERARNLRYAGEVDVDGQPER
jgi:hypothetical protein